MTVIDALPSQPGPALDDTARPIQPGQPIQPGELSKSEPTRSGLLTQREATPSGQPIQPTSPSRQAHVRIRRYDGSSLVVDVGQIAQNVQRISDDLTDTDPHLVAARTISGLYDGATEDELARLTIQTAAELTGTEPQYSRLAARLLADYIAREVRGQGVASFSQAISAGHAAALISDETARFVADHADELDAVADVRADRQFEYFGLRTVYDRYLLRHPVTRLVIETPQYFLLRVACGLSRTAAEATRFYRLMSSLAYLPSSPTLFNSGTRHPQMSSCFLVDSPRDELDSIYDRYAQVARLSKFSGGIGISWSRVRSRGALIRGTNGQSNGIVPFLRVLDSSVAAVNQGGRRKGAACAYLEPWHPDIEEFLELRDNTGEDARRTHNLNLANWIPDEFMRRVEADEMWSLIDPDQVPELPDLWGTEFDAAYRAAEAKGRYVRRVKARDLYARMMRTLAQTGNGWMTFKDRANATCNQTGTAGNVVHLSNLCTEIIEVTSDAETAVCNLGSVNLARHLTAPRPTAQDPAAQDPTASDPTAPGDAGLPDIDWARLRETVRTAIPFLDRVIDIGYYPSGQAARSNPRWRPVGLGVMGLQDVFFALRLPFDSPQARELSARIAEEIYLTALEASAELAAEHGAHPGFAQTRAAAGQLQPDLWGITDTARNAGGIGSTSGNDARAERWTALRRRIAATGLRNSLLIAIAPTATIASIAGCYECIEPQVSNLFKRETMSGEFLQVNTALVNELKAQGRWTQATRDAIKRADGSVQHLGQLPERTRALFRTAWELPQRALIDLAAARAPFIDQSQSLNLFLADPSIGKLSSMYLHAWKSGLKTTYYLRSRPATRIQQATTATTAATHRPEPDAAAIACSLENPETCEACQ